MSLLNRASIFFIVTSCAGCASIVNDYTHPMKIETLTSSGAKIDGAFCQVTNDYGSITIKSGEVFPVRRSSKDLEINCKDRANPEAVARAISRANAGLAGNIVFGGGIGALVDHSNGTSYTYPTWIQVEFGKTLEFDRFHEKEGQPLRGRSPAANR